MSIKVGVRVRSQNQTMMKKEMKKYLYLIK